MDFFFSGSVDQCAVGMIEKGAGIHVNPGGMMVTWFGYHCKREGLSSNPGVTLVFFSASCDIQTLYVEEQAESPQETK